MAGLSAEIFRSLEKRMDDKTPRILMREGEGTEAALQHHNTRSNSAFTSTIVRSLRGRVRGISLHFQLPAMTAESSQTFPPKFLVQLRFVDPHFLTRKGQAEQKELGPRGANGVSDCSQRVRSST